MQSTGCTSGCVAARPAVPLPLLRAYPASKGMTDMSANGNEAETAEAKKMIDMLRMIKEEGVKCLVFVTVDVPMEKG